MSEAAAQLVAAFRELPEGDRYAVREAINEAFVSDEDEANAELNATLRRRLADYEAGRTKGIDGEEFFRKLREAG